MSAVTVMVKQNDVLQQQMHQVTTLVQDPETDSYAFKEWAKMWELLRISEYHQQVLVLLSIMMEQPTFGTLDMLIGQAGTCACYQTSGQHAERVAGPSTLQATGQRWY
jgi:hypothetical protein